MQIRHVRHRFLILWKGGDSTMAFRKVLLSVNSLLLLSLLFFFPPARFLSQFEKLSIFLLWITAVVIPMSYAPSDTTGFFQKLFCFVFLFLFRRHFTVETHNIRRTTNPVWNATFKVIFSPLSLLFFFNFF